MPSTPAALTRAHAMPFGADRHRRRRALSAVGAVRANASSSRSTARIAVACRSSRTAGSSTTRRGARAGARYRYRIDGELFVPDPASRFNPDDVHGASVVVDPRTLRVDRRATGADGRGTRRSSTSCTWARSRRRARFAGVEARLDYLADLGVTAIELMPLADFPGKRNWGYDGVLPFAPDASYGTPDDLQVAVAAAHARGLMVLIDVVYNHFGPDGNYLHRIAQPFFTDRHKTPWGAAIDFDEPASKPVREFFIHNALYWLEEFHADGLRLDAVHAIVDDSSPDFLTELARRVREGPGREREIHLVLENDRNEAHRLARDDARRAARVHRAMERRLPSRRASSAHRRAQRLLRRLRGRAARAARPLPRRRLRLPGRAVAVSQARARAASRARTCRPTRSSTSCRTTTRSATARSASGCTRSRRPRRCAACLPIFLLAPSIPLLFMGEEFGADTPFLFFADFGGDLATAVRDGRRAEFAGFPPFDDEDKAASIPDPGAESTVAQSRLDWDSLARDPHAAWLRALPRAARDSRAAHRAVARRDRRRAARAIAPMRSRST